jgi:hypothetical protein
VEQVFTLRVLINKGEEECIQACAQGVCCVMPQEETRVIQLQAKESHGLAATTTS